MSLFRPRGLGWHEDLPDFRDYTPQHPLVSGWLGGLRSAGQPDPDSVDLREFFGPARDQAGWPTSAAHACVALVEYFQRRSFGMLTELSPLFLSQTAAHGGRAAGLPGVDLRTNLQWMVRCGVPPEHYWAYCPENVRSEPGPHLYRFTTPYGQIRYLRLDRRNTTGGETLAVVKAFLAAGFPSAFGFAVPDSLTTDGEIPCRPAFDGLAGGQAAVVVGYDDRRLHRTRGALLIRCSWGAEWGEQGYGWLPYSSVEQQMARCFWTLAHEDWLATGEFHRPGRATDGA
jgi:C1A family cysteine protease